MTDAIAMQRAKSDKVGDGRTTIVPMPRVWPDVRFDGVAGFVFSIRPVHDPRGAFQPAGHQTAEPAPVEF